MLRPPALHRICARTSQANQNRRLRHGCSQSTLVSEESNRVLSYCECEARHDPARTAALIEVVACDDGVVLDPFNRLLKVGEDVLYESVLHHFGQR